MYDELYDDLMTIQKVAGLIRGHELSLRFLFQATLHGYCSFIGGCISVAIPF